MGVFMCVRGWVFVCVWCGGGGDRGGGMFVCVGGGGGGGGGCLWVWGWWG